MTDEEARREREHVLTLIALLNAAAVPGQLEVEGGVVRLTMPERHAEEASLYRLTVRQDPALPGWRYKLERSAP